MVRILYCMVTISGTDFMCRGTFLVPRLLTCPRANVKNDSCSARPITLPDDGFGAKARLPVCYGF